MSISFDNAAHFYDETRGFPAGVETNAAAAIARVAGFTGGERVLEIGVGTGRIALPVAPYVQRYFGIDISPLMMRRLLEKRGDEPISLVQGDATRLPFPRAAFEAVMAVHIFHLIPGWQQVLVELARVLKPGGCLIHCWNSNDQAIDIETTLKELVSGGRAEAVGARGNTFLEESGWQVGEEEMYTFTRQQKPIEIVDQMRRRVWSRTWRLSDAQLAENVAALQQMLEQRFSDLHTSIEVQTTFHARIYLPPKT